MTEIPVVAIDGPAAAGKTVVGRAVAAHFGWTFFDTGVLYRALTWKALQTGTPNDDGARLAELAGRTRIQVTAAKDTSNRPYDVFVDGQDVSVDIRLPEVDRAVSVVSAHEEVRTALIDAQRSLRCPPGVVMAGRDIGTVIFPDATVKLYLDASPEIRARRRSKERGATSEQAQQAELRDVQQRDRNDSSRETAPLRPADDAEVIRTDDLDEASVVARAVELTKAALERSQGRRSNDP